MLKYLYVTEAFQEVPDEISLCISISGCPCRCEGCHSPELWEDKGTPLTYRELEKLIEQHPGITCVCFMGGDAEPSLVYGLAKYVKTNHKLKTCWYSGKDLQLPKLQLLVFDFIKCGPYKKELGGLTSETTNQVFYKVTAGEVEDLTYKFNTKK